MLDIKLIEGIILIYFSFLRWKSFWVLCDWMEDCRQQNVSRSFRLRVLVAWFHTKVFIGVTFLNQFHFKENNLFFVYIFYLIFRIPCKTLCPSFTPFLPPLPPSVLNQMFSHTRKSGGRCSQNQWSDGVTVRKGPAFFLLGCYPEQVDMFSLLSHFVSITSRGRTYL